MGLLNGTAIQALTAELDEGTSPDWIVAACEEAGLHGAKGWKYVEKILDRWKAEGFNLPRKDEPAPFVSGLGIVTAEEAREIDARAG
jgi:DnaD/phage-associated family protein